MAGGPIRSAAGLCAVRATRQPAAIRETKRIRRTGFRFDMAPYLFKLPFGKLTSPDWRMLTSTAETQSLRERPEGLSRSHDSSGQSSSKVASPKLLSNTKPGAMIRPGSERDLLSEYVPTDGEFVSNTRGMGGSPAVMGIPHPYLTAGIEGVGGRFKEQLEDFIVEEVPLYHPTDRGEHTFFELENADLSTREALERMARELSVEVGEFAFAGLKDPKGVTRQGFSVRLVPPERILGLKLGQIRILWARLHTYKLRVGLLRGNRFRIRVRGVVPDGARVDRIVEELQRLGLPNY